MTAGTRVVGYVRVSTAEQSDSGLGLAAQRTAIEAECERRGWVLVEMFEDPGTSGKSMANRPRLAEALRLVESRQVDGLVAAKLDRLSRSLQDFAGIMASSYRRKWSLIVLDIGVDTTTPTGKAMAQMMGVFAELEREMIGQRTKDALAVRKAQGVRLGRPRTLPAVVVDRVVAERGRAGRWRASRRI